jgi:hypothetical protein
MLASWEAAQHVTGVLVDVTLLLGAVGAIVKFQLFNIFGHRWHSTLDCAHYELPDGSLFLPRITPSRIAASARSAFGRFP